MADNVTVRVPEQQFIRGEDGFDPAVTIEDIEHGHRVTITDREHPVEGQSFAVMDGASAYEQAVDGDYEGTEEEFNADLASFKAKAQAATNAAAAAAQSAQNAAGSATTATTKAGEAADSAAAALTRMNSANSSAQAAANSAADAAASKTAAADSARAAKESEVVSNYDRIEAERSATAASRSASSASTAATTAQGHAANAASSATAAGNAQTAAETAQGKAEDAQEAAEQAQSDAETAAQSVSQSAAQIEQNKQDVADLKSAFDADLVNLSWTPNITKGSYFKIADGATGTSKKYARTALWNGYGTRKAIVVDDPTYEFCLALYDETGTSSGGGTGYLGYVGYTKGMSYIPQNATQFGVSFRRVDQADLTNEDVTAISAALSAFAATDTTLSVAGAPADSKATGDMLSTSILEKDILPANTDLNSFTNIGLYRIPSGDSVIPTLVNYPSSNPGRLLILSDANGYFCAQIMITSGNVIFTRIQTNASEHTWSDWASYDSSTVRTRGMQKNSDNVYDANEFTQNGIYGLGTASLNGALNFPSTYTGELIVFSTSAQLAQIYINRYGTVYYRVKYSNGDFTQWFRPLVPDTTLEIAGAAADAKTVGDAVRSGYVHDGNILRMSVMPEAIPVNENHMGYNEFISSTWNTLLPNDYQDGDAYNASTTKIHGVKVERASSWTSTPYGTNTDTYTIYRYIFTPQNGYDKTLFLTSGCHGNEAEAYWSLYRLVRMIYFEGHKYSTLRNLRDCRLIIIPSWNPWGFQHYRRYNAFESKNYQAWAWLMASNHEVTVNGTVYDISQVGEANVIWETLNEYQDSINLWLDFHTDPYAGRDTSNVDIDDPRGVTPPYGCYGFSAKDSRGYRQLFSVMYDFYNVLEDEYQFTETWHPQPTNPGGSSFTGWMAQFGFTSGVVEISTFMDNFPYASGSSGMMKLAQEYYGNCIAEMLR